MRTYKIHFIRHGLTEANLEGKYIGKTNLPLCSAGIERLEELKNKIDYPYVELVFSSPLSRCIETAEILFPAFEPTVIDELSEYDFGDFENKTAIELENEEAYKDWTSGKVPSPPNAEDPRDFTERLALGLNKMVRIMMEQGVYDAAAIMHGGAIMTLFSACALPRRATVEWITEDGLGYTVKITPSLYSKSGIIEVVDTVPTVPPEEE